MSTTFVAAENALTMIENSLKALLISLTVLCAGCSKNSPAGEPEEDKYYTEGKEYIDNLFSVYYWWYNQVPTGVTWTRDFFAYFDAHIVPQDRWSWMQTGEEWRDSQSGTVSNSFGISFAQPIEGYNDYNVYVRYVLLNSPMYNSGVRRGWRLDGIGGYRVNELIQSSEGINTLYVEMNKPTNEYVFTAPDSTSHTLNVTAAKISTPTYLDSRIFTSEDYPGLTGSVAYLNYRTFVSTMTSDIKESFAKFKTAGVQDLILDLRYNGGGSTEALDTMISLIAPEKLNGEIFSVMTHNDQLSSLDDSDLYSISDGTLALNRLFVITGNGTASASEVLINGLRDGLGANNLITVGDTTYGKPNGMYAFAYPEGPETDYYSSADYVFFPICFYSCNRAGEQIPDTGFIPVLCEGDDLYHDWGADERLISDCLRYIVNGSFGETKASDFGNGIALRAEGNRILVEEDAPGYGKMIGRRR